MNITTFTVEGPAIEAGAPIPRPSDVPVSPYPWDEFMADMQKHLDEYAKAGSWDIASGDMKRLAQGGTLYWIRADLDSGTRYIRVHVSPELDEMDFAIEMSLCTAAEVPGRLRLN